MSNVYPLKCRIRNEGAVTRVDVYDDIGEGGWFSEGLTAKAFAAQLSGVKGPLAVHINSAGGDCFDGIAITNSIRDYKGDTETICDGIAASIASVIFQAGAKRTVKKNAMVMIHDAFGLCVGNESEMTAMAATLGKVSDNIASVYADRSGRGTPESWRAEMKKECWYDADEAVAAGLADAKGDEDAQLPPSLDIASFTSLPAGIAARLREMPQARVPEDRTRPSAAAEQSCEALGHQCCKDATAAKGLLSGLVRDEIAAKWSAAAVLASAGTPAEDALRALGLPVNADGKTMHGDHERWDPDGDGDCDACPEGDTDNSHWTEEGQQVKEVPGKPMPAGDRALTADDIRAIFREEIAAWRNAGSDDSSWDGPAAMSWAGSQDNPESAFRSICAGEKTSGEPDTQAHWALPHHKHAGDPPNAHGVSAALGRLDQTQGLKDKGAAEAHLKAHQAAAGGSDDDGADDRAGTGLSGFDPEQFRAALRGATR